MRDMHCHILPGVDDGAHDLGESLAMLEAAKKVGITSIVCTPHVRDPYFDYDAMLDAYDLLCAHAGGFPIAMGWEVNHTKLMELGMEWAPYLGFRPMPGSSLPGPNGLPEFLLELPTHCTKADFQQYERTIYDLQCLGFEVIIAHPERYQAIQKDIELARDLVRQGCKLQASADFVAGGRFGKEKKPAKKLFEENLYTYIGSDAHFVKHYDYFAEARRTYRCRGSHARA